MSLIAGKYQIIKPLGEGGSGVVYLVRHVDLGVDYALKVLNKTVSDNSKFITSFKSEAALLLRFTHPGTTQLRDFGKTAEGNYYLAMDYCEGRTLKEVIEHEGPYHSRGALDVIIQILDVLASAHSEGIIHRDIKPGNIMIEDLGGGKERAKLLDFGTAVMHETFDPTSTEERVSLGTPCYMSPEQATGGGVLSPAVDIYAVGIVLYELLTGSVPFDSRDVVQTLVMHITQPPLPFAERCGVPLYVEELVFKALKKNPADRYHSARDFKNACVDVLARLENERASITPSAAIRAVQVERKEKSVEKVESKSTKILCLDDDEMILNILKHILEAEGFEVFTALDCSAIHEHLFNDNIKMLISDVQMPGMPGTKVCKLLKSSIQDLKVLLFSNIPERDLEKAAAENKADGWISKNGKPADWLGKIKEIAATIG